MASFGGVAAMAGVSASSAVRGLFVEGVCLQHRREVRRGGGDGGVHESNNEGGGFSSCASSFCGQRFGGSLVSSSCQERQLPLCSFPCRAAPQPRAFTGGATTTTEEEQKSSKERRSSVLSSSGSMKSTLYDVLGVSKSSSTKEIKAAYRQAARKLHPDVVPAEQRQDSTKNFLLIQNAYHVLSDDQSRAAYDLQLAVQQPRISISMQANWGFTASPPSSYTSTDFCSPFKGRSWETDQCW